MRKYYKERTINVPIHYDDICECGHGWERHEVNFLSIHRYTKCEICLCPKYKLDKDNLSEIRKKHIK